MQSLTMPEIAAGTCAGHAQAPATADSWSIGRMKLSRLPLLTKLYVWSLIFEPLLFFVLWDRLTAGISGNLSRILQIVVILGLILRNVMRPGPLVMIRFSSKLYRNYAIFATLAVVAGIVGALSGAYHVPATFATEQVEQSLFAAMLNSPLVRPLFEYVILVYQLVYFIVLPRYLMKDESAIDYFFSAFKKMFWISLVLGFIDLAFAMTGVGLVPRHIADWRFVGARFHGLAGEPRDAFVYLFLGLALLHLESYRKGRKLSKLLVFTVIASALLTQSASGLIGVTIFIVLFSVDSLVTRMDVRRLLLVTSVLVIVPCVIYGAVNSSERLLMYIESASDLWDLLESGTALPYLMMVQSPNIYPLYDLTVKAREMNILPILLGSGMGSASAVNNHYASFASGELLNPNSQLVRSLFEYGLVGTFFFIRSFVYPVKQLTRTMERKDRSVFIVLALLLMGCFLGQRSAAPFIYLGIFFAVFAPRSSRTLTGKSPERSHTLAPAQEAAA